MSRQKQQVFAVLRVDGIEKRKTQPPVNWISVNKVVLTEQLAEKEVARLNELQRRKDCEYIWLPTRLVTGIE